MRGVFYDPGVERLFCVSGGEFYELGEGGAATKIGDVATGRILERLFCVSGGEFYELGEGGAATKIGDVATGILVTWASNGVGGQQIMLTSGGRGYIFDLRDDTFTPDHG